MIGLNLKFDTNKSAPSIRRALVSVSDKTGLIEFAQALSALNIEILSTGGTAKLLQAQHIPVIEVSDYTGFPEIMEGRVKTLHPKIHGGLLGRRGIDDKVMQQHDIAPIDLLVVNLYPFQATIAKPDCDLPTAIENIDIGGPAMLRAAAKNYAHVTVLVDSNDYTPVLEELKQTGTVSDKTRFKLAQKVFAHTAEYDAAVAKYLGVRNQGEKTDPSSVFPNNLQLDFYKKLDLRYGENPHQKAALYVEKNVVPGTVSHAELLQGKELSYNNLADADAALECVKSFVDQTACVIVKHANPCGVAVADTQLAAYDKAYRTDPTSAFGGIIAFNTPLTAETAQAIIERQFVEVIIAPNVDAAAKIILAKKPNVRVLCCGPLSKASASYDYKRLTGGLLVQDNDSALLNLKDLRIVTKTHPSETQLRDLIFAWQVVKFVKSNAIVFAREQMTLGVGAGQMSRIISTKIAAMKAADENLPLEDCVMASDAFFPFRDNVDLAAETGIKAIIQPGGSIRDPEVIAAADEHGIAMLFTGMRHFRH